MNRAASPKAMEQRAIERWESEGGEIPTEPRFPPANKAMACIDYAQGPILPVTPVVESLGPTRRERLFHGAPFEVTRVSGKPPFTVGAMGTPRVLVGLAGDGQVLHEGVNYPFGKGDVVLLPAVVGACVCPAPGGMTLLEVSLPEVA